MYVITGFKYGIICVYIYICIHSINEILKGRQASTVGFPIILPGIVPIIPDIPYSYCHGF